jgi:Low-density lipoprotein receptor domain class A
MYQPVSLVTHECIGQVLECSAWTCQNNQTILARGVCDGRADCEDKSDEEKGMCKGDGGLVSNRPLRSYSQPFIFFLAYKWVQLK